ncbi:MAG TPA: twin-arginine translocation signal domain-containing protein, partial [Gemmatimonadetes bacterium]|nr:twin-arginine translocation signal domain-containing protein [Gemmatimonadota bacterium]
MSSKSPDRRGFLKRGAAVAGGLTLGAAAPVIRDATAADEQSAEDQSREGQDWSSDELVAYGERSQ